MKGTVHKRIKAKLISKLVKILHNNFKTLIIHFHTQQALLKNQHFDRLLNQ